MRWHSRQDSLFEDENENVNESVWTNSLPTRDQENAAPRETEKCAIHTWSSVPETESLLCGVDEAQAHSSGQTRTC